MIKKNSAFLFLLFLSIISLTIVVSNISKIKEDKLIKERLIKERSTQSSAIINQEKIDENQRFTGKFINNPNEKSYVLLEWEFDKNNIQKVELYINDQFHSEIGLSENTKKIFVLENKLNVEGNSFTLKLYNKDGIITETKNNVNIGYVFDNKYSIIKINDQLYLEFSYYTKKQSPVTSPEIVESSKMKLSEASAPVIENEESYTKTTYQYTIDITEYSKGTHREILLWKINSINYDFTQIVEFSK